MSAAAENNSPLADALKKSAPLIVGAAAVAGSTLGADLPPWAQKMLEQWGPAGVLLLGIVWYIPRSAVQDFIAAQKDQAVALTSVAESIKALPQKDHMKFEELLIGQEMLHRSLDRVHERLDGLAQVNDGAN